MTASNSKERNSTGKIRDYANKAIVFKNHEKRNHNFYGTKTSYFTMKPSLLESARKPRNCLQLEIKTKIKTQQPGI